MSLPNSVIDAMVAAGCSVEQLAAAVKAASGDMDARTARKREVDAARKRRQRANNSESHDMSRGQSVTPSDIADDPLSPKESSPTPPKEITPYPQNPSTPKGVSSPLVETDSIFDAWDEMAGRTGLAKVRVRSPARRAGVSRLIRQTSLSTVLEAIGMVGASPFCAGENDRGWRADFDFLLQAKSFGRILEGAYTARSPSARASPSNSKPTKSEVFATLRERLRDGQQSDGRSVGPDGNHGQLLSLPKRAG